jgi:hypothetical protein
MNEASTIRFETSAPMFNGEAENHRQGGSTSDPVGQSAVTADDNLVISFAEAMGQPEPLDAFVTTTPKGDYTSVTRTWRTADVARCRLCPAGRCRAHVFPGGGAFCNLMVRGRVLADDAAGFDATRLNWPKL